MAAKSYYLDNAVLTAVLKAGAAVGPLTPYVGLFTVNPANPGDPGTEVLTAGGTLYARVAVTFGTVTNGVVANSAPVAFVAAGASWGTVNGVGIYDNITVGAGNLLYYGTLGTPKLVGIGDSVSFATSALSVTEQ